MTNQREIILRELLASKQHLTADELYDIVKKIMPRISLATVYRNLEILSEAGLVGKLEISGRQKRFDYELDVINKMGFAAYFLIVSDFISYARNNEISVGPGRGSAAGSIIAYSLGITNIDPLCSLG